MSNIVKYDAFISYRHCEPDKEIAAKIQSRLENYRFPKDVAKKTGRTRLTRIFRDETEFAVSDNLSEEIESAIRNSEFLIAICSPDYLTSPWCMRELETFLQNSDRRNVLLVLANGEPDTAFPDILLYEDVYRTDFDGSRIRVRLKSEPLAADCRAESSKERDALIDRAALRLAAPIAGVKYDDLVQRQRKEENRRRTRLILTAFGVLLTVLGISLGFLAKISKQNQIITAKYADTLAATSTNLLSDGRRTDAVYAARIALPDKRTDTYSEAAGQAIVNALGLYDLPGYYSDTSVQLPSSMCYNLTVSPMGGYASFIGLDSYYYVIDLNNGSTVFSFKTEGVDVFAFDGERGFVFRQTGENVKYYDLSDHSQTDLGYSDITQIYTDDLGSGYAVSTGGKIVFYKGSNALCDFVFRDYLKTHVSMLFTTVHYTPDGKAYIFVTDFDLETTTCYLMDIFHGYCESVTLPFDGMLLNYNSDGKSLVWSEIEDGKECLYSWDFSTNIRQCETGYEFIGGVAVSDTDIICCADGVICHFDSELNLIETIRSNGSIGPVISNRDVIVIYVQSGGAYTVHDNLITFVNVDRPAKTLAMQQYSNGTLYFADAGDSFLIRYTYRESDYLTRFMGRYESIEFPLYGDAKIERFKQSVLANNKDMDGDMIYCALLCENSDIGLIQLWNGEVGIYDTKTYKRIKTIYSMEGNVESFYYDENAGLYYISAESLEVYDQDLKHFYTVKDCQLIGIDSDTGNPVVVNWDTDSESKYLFVPVTYEDVISMADELLDGYEPDERTKEKYALG